MLVEILPHKVCMRSFMVVFDYDVEDKEIEKIPFMMGVQKLVMAELIEKKYLPKQSEIKKSENGFYYFEVIPKRFEPMLKQDLQKALLSALAKT